MSSVLNYLEETVENYPNKIAVADKNEQISFTMLKKKSLILAKEILKDISDNNRPIVVFLPKSVMSIISFVSILYSRNFYVPVDVKQPKERVRKIIDSLNTPIIITNNRYYLDILELCTENVQIINTDMVAFDDELDFIDKNSIKMIDTDIVYTLFTSGSTGEPKGVAITNRSVIDYIDWAVKTFNITHKTIMGNQSPLHFDISTQEIYACFKTGATLYLIPEEYFAFPAKLLEYINSKYINHLYWVPSAFINVANYKLLEKIPLTTVTTMMFGGEVMPIKQLNYWRAHLPSLNLIANVYGPTEATVNCTYYIIDREFSNQESLPLGFPVANTEIILLDEDLKHVKEPNVLGELCIRGSSLAVGYWNNPNKTNEVFINNPLVKEYNDRIYRTGDLAFYSEQGLLMYSGRKDYQIKHQGYRIELGEIETVANSLEEITMCCALYDNNRKKIVLCYSGIQDEKRIMEKLRGFLPKYMIPNKIIFCDRIPLNGNGKVDRVKVREYYNA